MINNYEHDRDAEDRKDDPAGSDTHAGNTGGNIPNDAASYDADYDPGASELSGDLADEFEKNGPGMPNPTKP